MGRMSLLTIKQPESILPYPPLEKKIKFVSMFGGFDGYYKMGIYRGLQIRAIHVRAR